MASGTFWRQFKALNRKNYIIFRRNRRAIIWEFVIPILFAGLFVILGTQIPASEVREGSKTFYEEGYMIEPFVVPAGPGPTSTTADSEYPSIEVDPGWVGAGKDLAFIQSKQKFTEVETFLEDNRGISVTKEFDNFNDPRNEIRREGEDTRLAGALEVNLIGEI